MQIRSSFKILAMLAVFAFVALACSNSSSSSPAGGQGSTSSSATETETSSPSGGDDEHVTLDVSGKSTAEVEADNEGSNYYFKPSTLQGKAGQSITLTIHNEGNTTHTFTIDDQSVDVELSPDQEQDVTVTFPDSGSVEFYCKFHVSLGMKGELKVA